MNVFKVVSRTAGLGAALFLQGCDSSQPEPVEAASVEPVVGANSNLTHPGAVDAHAPPLIPSGIASGNLSSTAANPPPIQSVQSQSVQSQLSAAPAGPLGSLDVPIVAPPLSSEGEGQVQAQSLSRELLQQPFMTLQPIHSTVPTELIDHLRQIDVALQDLVLAGSSSSLDEQTFIRSGLRLGRMKQAAGLQLAQSPEASESQRKAGVLAQLVALSHMSGLRDVESAQELERFANALSASDDPDLAHQAAVVIIGFELQSLQNGVRSTPDQLLTHIGRLFTRPEDRGFPEFMVLQQAQQVLRQMGFTEQADQVQQTLVEAYRTSPDRKLRGEAWLIETQSSQAYQNFLQAFRSLGSEQFDAPAALSSLRGLYEQFPSLQTLEQIASTITNIEYSGHVPLSQDVASFTRQKLADFPNQDTTLIESALAAHTARTALLGQTLDLSELVGFDGKPLEIASYAGKVVLVDFWASWCVKCMRELPAIRQSYADFAGQGFDVLGVNMDENLASGRSFVEQQKFPWRSFHNRDVQELGFKSALAQKLGVTAIPFMLLLDRDGRVAALHVRGEQLGPAIAKLVASDPNREVSP